MFTHILNSCWLSEISPCICFDIDKLTIFTGSKDSGKPLLWKELFGGQVAPKMRGNFSLTLISKSNNTKCGNALGSQALNKYQFMFSKRQNTYCYLNEHLSCKFVNASESAFSIRAS